MSATNDRWGQSDVAAVQMMSTRSVYFMCDSYAAGSDSRVPNGVRHKAYILEAMRRRVAGDPDATYAPSGWEKL